MIGSSKPAGGIRRAAQRSIQTFEKKGAKMIVAIIVILLILWLLGVIGPRYYTGFPRTGGAIHTLIVIAIILLILRLLGVI